MSFTLQWEKRETGKPFACQGSLTWEDVDVFFKVDKAHLDLMIGSAQELGKLFQNALLYALYLCTKGDSAGLITLSAVLADMEKLLFDEGNRQAFERLSEMSVEDFNEAERRIRENPNYSFPLKRDMCKHVNELRNAQEAVEILVKGANELGDNGRTASSQSQ